MGVPIIQQYHVIRYILEQKKKGKEKYPLVLMLEPLFKCNLRCAGCGKIAHPKHILEKYMSKEECWEAVEECGAPVVSVAGGEPLLHEEIKEIVEGIIARKRFVYLCTNAILLKQKIHLFKPSPFFTFSIHLDGYEEQHDRSVSKKGAFKIAIDAIKTARRLGFRITINCTLYNGVSPEKMADFLDFVMGLGVEGVTIAPGFNYERAREKDLFLQKKESKRLFRELLKLSKGRNWRFNHTIFYLDFLAGNRVYKCTPWGNPTRNVLGWQRPCYLLDEGGYAKSFKELIEDTDWEKWGPGKNPKCDNCLLHSGFEATAVNDMIAHPFDALRRYIFGIRTDGPILL